MKESILIRDPNFHVNDFDAATDVLPMSSEHESHNPPHWGAMPPHEMEFTTEWQMEAEQAAE